MTEPGSCAPDHRDDDSTAPGTEHGGAPARSVGIVIIGRNEGQRLVDCLASVASVHAPTVYVDSGSTDGSVAAAQGGGTAVVRLDMSRPFTAARARNAGFRELIGIHPDLDFVQFVDGDCVLDPRWIGAAVDFLNSRPDVALVFGRRREMHPDASIFNAMCDEEWDAPVGQALECGGDTLIRVDAFKAVQGFSDTLIAGEEPDLCVRLRANGWSIWRLGAEMTRHDANITRFSQWWRRSVRAGHAFAEGSRRHAGSEFGIWKPSLMRAVVWGGLPILAVAAALLWHPVFVMLLGLLPLQVIRLGLRRPAGAKGRWARAFFSVLGKFPEFQGVARFYASLLRKGDRTIIEYK